MVEAADHLEVLPAGQVLVDGRVLAGEPDALAHLRRLPGHVEAGDGGRPVVRRERGQDPHRRGLAGAVGAEETEDASRVDREVDSAERPTLP